jgi:hypothetical protein
MELEIRCAESAFRHGLIEADIVHAVKTQCYDGLQEDSEDVYLLLGFDTNLNLIEVLYREVGDNGMFVFHAMPCRQKYYQYLV